MFRPVYICRCCYAEPSDWVAKDNEASYGHICYKCYRKLPESSKLQYAPRGTGNFA